MVPSNEHTLLTKPTRCSPTTTYQSAKIIPDENVQVTTCRTAKYRKPLGLPLPTIGKIDLVSLSVIYYITLISEAARGLVMPSQWPYFESVGGTKSLLGLLVGVLSFGRMLVTMPLGTLSDKYSSAQIFYISALIQIIGHIMYCIFPNPQLLILSRLVVGLGSSTLSVCRAYITKSIPQQQRTHHFAYLSALQFIGFCVLPGVGSLLTYLPKTTLFWGILPLNGFTYPALLLVICCALIVFVTFFFYEDPQMTMSNAQQQQQQQQQQLQSISTTNNQNQNQETTTTTTTTTTSQSNADYLALIVCVIVNMVFRGLVAELETITTPFLMEQYNLSFSASGTYLTIFGFIGLFIYSIFKPISRIFSDRYLIFIGLIVTFICTFPLIFHSMSMSLPLLLYVVFLGALWSVAYPIGQTGALSLFSKVMKSLPPGGLLGIFSATGSGARIGFAVLAGAIWGAFGREAVFTSIIVCTIASILLVVISWKRLFG